MVEMVPKLLSILICTRNRERLLAQALDSLAVCRVPRGWSIELIAVDNGSTDGTAAVIALAAAKLPFPVRSIVEPQPGLGRAHAAGLAACTGELIACTDDDCLVSPDWCEAIVQGFEAQPELAGLFGRVLPIDEGGDPAWRIAIKTSEEPATYRFPCWPIIGFGNNMAFRRTALESAGGFNPLFGPGSALWSAEELELTYRLLRGGRLLAYAPSVVVRHRLRATRAGWAATHVRDALGFGAFTGAYAARGDLFAFKLAIWEWQGMLTSWWRGVRGREVRRRQVSGWYARWLPVGFLAGVWQGFRKDPAPRPAGAVLIPPASPDAPPSPLVSVIVATRNRAGTLDELLRSVAQQEGMPVGTYEVIVVDNGSRDATRTIVARHQRMAAPRVTYVFEPRPGTSRARNAGARVAAGELLAFTDDDCVVSPDWVGSILRHLRADADAAGLFGRVLPLNGHVSEGTVSVKTSEQPRRYAFPCSPFVGHGNNMAFRRAAFAASRGFNEALGPGAPLHAAEDVDLAYRLLRGGHALAYEPSCVVSHRSRDTAAEAQAAEWRNAIGIGACFGQHLAHGDLFAAKCAMWFVEGVLKPRAAQTAGVASGARPPRWLVAVGVPYGLLKGLSHGLTRGMTGASTACTP